MHLEKELYLTTFVLIPTEFILCAVFSWRSYHTREVRVYFARWFMFIRKYKSYFVKLVPYMSYYYLTIIEKEPSSNEKFTWFVLSPTGMGVNFKRFTFVHVRGQIRHRGTGALTWRVGAPTYYSSWKWSGKWGFSFPIPNLSTMVNTSSIVFYLRMFRWLWQSIVLDHYVLI